MAARHFANPAAFRAWLREHHGKASELVVLYYKRHTGKPSMTWAESVAEALCFGWIDGVRRGVDAERYTIRFTPRRKTSRWSAVNIRLVAELEAGGRLMGAGRAAFEARRHKTGPLAEGYRAQKREGVLDAARLGEFKRNKAAWAFFQKQPPGYRKLAAWWVMQAKREETRDRRLGRLIAESGKGRRVGW